jgi:hypothetical protein
LLASIDHVADLAGEWTMTAAERAILEQLRAENQALRAEVAALGQTVGDLLV